MPAIASLFGEKKATRSGGNTIIYTACTTWLHASSLVRLYFIIICEFSMCLFLWCSNPAVFTTLWAPIWCFLHRVKTIMVSFFIMPALRVKIKFKRHYIQSAGRFRCMITHVTPFLTVFLWPYFFATELIKCPARNGLYIVAFYSFS